MQKKKKHWKRYLFMIILLGIYAIRVIFVNADNDKARVHYVNEKETARTKNMEISISDATLYDTPAFWQSTGIRRNIFQPGVRIIEMRETWIHL